MERDGLIYHVIFTAKQSSIVSTLRMSLPFVSTILDKRSKCSWRDQSNQSIICIHLEVYWLVLCYKMPWYLVSFMVFLNSLVIGAL